MIRYASITTISGALANVRTQQSPHSQVSGKLQAAGVVFIVAGVMMTVSGVWWGPAVLLPGVLLLIIGWF